VTPFRYTTPLQAITRRAGRRVKVSYDDGSDPARAANVARVANVAIVFASDSEGEYMDKACASVDCTTGGRTGSQDALIASVAAANPNTIVVLETGDPVLTPWRNSVKGLLEAWYPGEEGGNAIAAALFGDVDPGGRLPVTFPASESRFPTSGNPLQYPGASDVLYSERLDVGYRWYDAHDIVPAFPFGFGLSYARFRLARLRIQRSRGARGIERVSFEVVNTGPRSGIAVPELYVADPPASGEPPRQLRGYEKITLAAGGRQRVTLRLGLRSFAHWDTSTGSWRADPGCYGVRVGFSSRNLPLRGAVPLGGASCSTAPGRPAGRASVTG
jgi:beta-glucosidase